jgi:hypothetical protein
LRTKVAVFDPHVQQPDSEHPGVEILNPDKDLHPEIRLGRPEESSLAYPLLVNDLRMVVKWT